MDDSWPSMDMKRAEGRSRLERHSRSSTGRLIACFDPPPGATFRSLAIARDQGSERHIADSGRPSSMLLMPKSLIQGLAVFPGQVSRGLRKYKQALPSSEGRNQESHDRRNQGTHIVNMHRLNTSREIHEDVTGRHRVRINFCCVQ